MMLESWVQVIQVTDEITRDEAMAWKKQVRQCVLGLASGLILERLSRVLSLDSCECPSVQERQRRSHWGDKLREVDRSQGEDGIHKRSLE